MKRHVQRFALSLLFVLLYAPTVLPVNFSQCLKDLQGNPNEVGGTNNRGQPVPIEIATGITYELCTRACTSEPEPFQWPLFSGGFNAWLLPWIALVAQLPFDSEDQLTNVIAVLLTIGSPTLAIYSMALTVLNDRWIRQRFSTFTFPNTGHAVRILSSLQQFALQVSHEKYHLASLIVLPDNDKRWRKLVMSLDYYTRSWSFSAIVPISLSALSYLFTVIDSFTGDMKKTINANGQGVGSVWLWLLPLVIGWLRISTKCKSKQLKEAVKRATDKAFVAMPSNNPPTSNDPVQPAMPSNDPVQPAMPSNDPVLAKTLPKPDRAITLRQVEDPLYHDEMCANPIYNYSRLFSWVEAVGNVSDMFRAASEKAARQRPVKPNDRWEQSGEGSIHPNNRRGTREQVEEYCLLEWGVPRRRTAWSRDVFSRIIMASIMALSVQWGTTGAAVVVVWFTPTIGLGCRSGAYLLHGAASTVVWIMHLASSLLSYYVTTTERHPSPEGLPQPPTDSNIALEPTTHSANTPIQRHSSQRLPSSPTLQLPLQNFSASSSTLHPSILAPPLQGQNSSKPTPAHSQSSSTTPLKIRLARQVSINLRYLGKILACLNAIWLLVACIFQFSNFFDRCWCNSSYLGLGANAWAAIDLTAEDVRHMKNAWIYGIALAFATTVLSILLMVILVPKSRQTSED